MFVDYLLNLHEVCGPTLLVYASTQVPGPRIVSAPASDQQKGDLVALSLKVHKVNITVHERHHPLFTLENIVHLSYEEVVPHHLVLPGLVLLQLTALTSLKEVMRINICVINMSAQFFHHGRVVQLALPLFVLAGFPHHVLLQGAGQIIRVAKVEALTDVHLLEVVKILRLVFFVLARRVSEEGKQLDVFYRVNTVSQNFGHSLAFGDQHQVVTL